MHICENINTTTPPTNGMSDTTKKNRDGMYANAILASVAFLMMGFVGIALLGTLQDSVDWDEVHFQLNNQSSLDLRSCSELIGMMDSVWTMPAERKEIITEDIENAMRYKGCQ
jgi:hypothetical protein